MISAIRCTHRRIVTRLCCVGCRHIAHPMVMRGPEVSCRSTRTVLDSPTRSGCALSSLGSGECAAAALHDLDPVPRRVLRGNRAKALPLPADADHMSVVGHIVPVQIGVHGHGLACAHALELSLLKLAVESTHRRAARPRGAGDPPPPAARLHGAFGDHAADRRDELGAMQGGVPRCGKGRPPRPAPADDPQWVVRRSGQRSDSLLAGGGDVARVVVTASRAVRKFPADMARRRWIRRAAQSSSAVRSACSRWSIWARKFLVLRDRPRTWRTARGQIRFRIGLGDL